MFKKIFALISLLIFAGGVVGGAWWFKLKPQGPRSPQMRVLNLGDRTPIELPEKSEEPAILLFWATWCGPCKIEMNRLKTAVQSGKVPGMQVYAVSVGENPDIVEDYVLKNEFPFQFFVDPDKQGTKEFIITGTPTIYHINQKNEVIWAATGIAPDSIQRAEQLFK